MGSILRAAAVYGFLLVLVRISGRRTLASMTTFDFILLLIISEATGISREGLGWPYAPGLWSAAQVEGWKLVTDKVHAAGGRIVAQLWHMGRLVHGSVSGLPNISASATTAPLSKNLR